MAKFVLDNIPFKLDRDQILKSLHIQPEDDDAETLESFIREAESIGRPRTMYSVEYIESKGEDYVLLGGIKFTSKILRQNLDSVNRAFPFIATCGMELEDWALSKNDPLEQYWAFTINQFVLGKASEAVIQHIKDNHNPGNLAQMNPGSLESWPLSEQRNLFALLGDPLKDIGVELTESLLMRPVKTVSGILFSNDDNYENCQLCPRENCPGRRAPFRGNL